MLSELRNFVFSDDVSSLTILVFCLMLATGVGVFVFLFRQLTKPKPDVTEELEDTFDGIHEKDNPTPYGMHLVMFATVLFCVWYVAFGFPIFEFDQYERYAEEVAEHNAKFNERWRDMDAEEQLAMGESIFNTQCVICHGANARAQTGRAANLIHFGNEEHVVHVLKNGSKGLGKLTPAMPAQYENLGTTEEERERNARDVAAYVVTLTGRRPAGGADPEAGKAVFMGTCFACHGADGKGRGPTGTIPDFAANLTEYGKPGYIKDILKKGKKGYIGTMPAFDAIGVLSEVQYDAVSEYVATRLN